MLLLMKIIGISCTFQFVNMTTFKVNKYDRGLFKRAEMNCKRLYNSCPKTVYKTGERDYKVVCK